MNISCQEADFELFLCPTLHPSFFALPGWSGIVVPAVAQECLVVATASSAHNNAYGSGAVQAQPCYGRGF